MKKIGKSTKLYLIGIVVGAVVFGITTVVADTIINSTNVSYKTTTVKAALDDLYGLTADDIWKKIYPVGAIYISVSSTSPATLFGGTWVAFGAGRTLIGMGNNGTTNYSSVEATGGSDSYKLTPANLFNRMIVNNVNSSGSNKTVTVARPASATLNNGAFGYTTLYSAIYDNTSLNDSAFNSYHTTEQPFDIRSSYITVYMWKRTA